MNSELGKAIRGALKTLRPPPMLTVSEWADRERYLSPESSAEPGRWRTDRAPHTKLPMDCVKIAEVRELVLMWSAQLGKTETLNNIIGYFSEHEPCPMLLVQPTLGMAATYSKDRLAPMIRDSPALSRVYSGGAARSSGNTVLNKKFPGGYIAMSGANSPASLASRPVRVVFFDEVDRFPPSAGTEGDPVSLGKKRTTTFFNKLSVMVSTPTIKGASRIERSFNESNQHRRFVSCPGCGDKFCLRFSDAGTSDEFWEGVKYRTLKWESGRPETAHFVCEACGMVIDQSLKHDLIMNAEWIPMRPEIRDIWGFAANELYSPWKTWTAVIEDFLKAKGNQETLKTFVNTSLGETWEIQGDAPEWKRLYDRRGNWSSNTIPHGVKFLTAAVDVQKNRLEVEIKGWGENFQNWSIDYRIFLVDTSQLKSFDCLDEILREKWKAADGYEISILRLAIDSGYQTQNVYKWARRWPRSKVMVVKGADDLDRIFEIPKWGDRRTIKDGEGIPVWRLGVSIIKREIYGWLKQEIPSDDEIKANGYPPGFAHFPADRDEEYFKMLTAEVEDIKYIRGFPHYIWVKRYDRNEALDLAVYNRAAASTLGIDRRDGLNMDRMESISREAAKQDPQKSAAPIIKRKKSSFLG